MKRRKCPRAGDWKGGGLWCALKIGAMGEAVGTGQPEKEKGAVDCVGRSSGDLLKTQNSSKVVKSPERPGRELDREGGFFGMGKS